MLAAAARMRAGGAPWASRSVRITISAGLLLILFVGMDWAALWRHVERLQIALAVLVMILFTVQLALSSWKWQWALRIHGLAFPYAFLTRVLVIGFFLNNFLPTSIGGDAYRIYRTLPQSPPKSRAVSAVVLERVTGLGALLLLGLAGALLLYSKSELARAYVLLMAGGAVLVAAVLALMRARPARWLASWELRSRWLAPIRENLRSIRAARAEWIFLVGLSMLFQAQAIIILYVLFNALGVHAALAQAALIAAAAGVATVIPFSINGLGIVEATIAGAAVAVGVSYEAGVLVALLMRILIIPLTLLAGLVYAVEPVHVRDVKAAAGNGNLSIYTDTNTDNRRNPG